jgi:hypothetical protein
MRLSAARERPGAGAVAHDEPSVRAALSHRLKMGTAFSRRGAIVDARCEGEDNVRSERACRHPDLR